MSIWKLYTVISSLKTNTLWKKDSCTVHLCLFWQSFAYALSPQGADSPFLKAQIWQVKIIWTSKIYLSTHWESDIAKPTDTES